jgi:GR25 family glycosyltransferase involved in LPS biosynthesis
MVKWFGKKLCDKGFIINLKERGERYERSIKNLEIAGITNVDRFEAVRIEDPNFLKYGCTQSHIEIAKKQLKNKWDYVLYLEDDIVTEYFYDFGIPQEKVDRESVALTIINEINEKKPDVIWLGTRPEDYTEYISNCFVKPKKTLMSHAYIGSIKFAEFLVENLRYYDINHFSTKWPIDFFISQINAKDCHYLDSHDKKNIMKSNDLKVYMTTPMIFTQGEAFSDLTDEWVSYEIWIKGCYQEYVNINKLNIKPIIYE